MTKGLTDEELKKLRKIFCPRDIEIMISKFGVANIRKVINEGDQLPNTKNK